MVGWHHQLNGHEFEQAQGDDEEQGSLTCYSPWGCKELDSTELLNKNNNIPLQGFPWWFSSISLQCRILGFDPWLRKIPWKRTWQPTPVFLPRKFHGQRSLAGFSPWIIKELDRTQRLKSNNNNNFILYVLTTFSFLFVCLFAFLFFLFFYFIFLFFFHLLLLVGG